MKINLKKSLIDGVLCLIPLDKMSFEDLNKTKNNTVFQCKLTRPRNYKFHRKFFALLSVVFDMQERYSNINDLRVEMELRAGSYDEHITIKGKIIYIPKSISFAKMTQQEFEKLYSKCIDVALQYFCKNLKRDELENVINAILKF